MIHELEVFLTLDWKFWDESCKSPANSLWWQTFGDNLPIVSINIKQEIKKEIIPGKAKKVNRTSVTFNK